MTELGQAVSKTDFTEHSHLVNRQTHIAAAGERCTSKYGILTSNAPCWGEPQTPEEICPKLGQISHQTKGVIPVREIAKSMSLRLTEEEYIALQARAKEYGLKIEPTVRRIIAETHIETRPPEVYSDLLRELSSIGKQINQIAYQANVQKRIRDEEVSRAVALVRKAYTLIESNL